MRNFENWMNLTHPDPYSKDFEAALSASDLSELVETIVEICTDEARENPVMKLFRIKAICKGLQSKLDLLLDGEDEVEDEGEDDDFNKGLENIDLLEDYMASLNKAIENAKKILGENR